MKKLNVGVIGLGTIGSGVVKALKEKRHIIAERSGVDLVLSYACDTRRSKGRRLGLPSGIFTVDPQDLIKSDKIDVIVELIGGHHPAKELIVQALKNGKHVVTANKALLATDINELLAVARKSGRQLKFEASVCGGIPIIKSLCEGLVANKVDSFYGIINGTSNYLLTKMREESLSFFEALALAKKKGYAERNPRFDVEGIDAAHKLVILMFLAFAKLIPLEKVFREGISDISELDIKYAHEMGLVIKPLAIAKKVGDDLEARVHPTLLPRNHMLAAVNGVFNAVLCRGDMVGDMLFYGRGAGSFPTASAIISDLVDLGKGRTPESFFVSAAKPRVKRVRRLDEIVSNYYLRFTALDKPGVLARIAGVLGKHHIGIAQVSQKEYRRAKFVPVVMITDRAREKDLRRALDDIDKLAIVKSKTVKIRMEDI
ncbi:MAG TPA: homoserine dehydrogenase [Candidatus Omnitrophica bacterium]|nr:homoserine dehydrogenase [Candidatus Omnitrophota bacterium]